MTRGNVIKNRALYEELVCSHARDLYRFALRLTGTEHRAEDLVQETMFHAWRSIGTLRDRSKMRAWILQILHNRHKHLLRSQSRRISATTDPEQVNQTTDHTQADVLARLSDQELLQRSLDELDVQYKEPFLLVFMEGLTCRQTAELLDLPLGTVLTRVYQARRRLRGTLRRLDPDDDQGQTPRLNKRPADSTDHIGKNLIRENE